ncbi:hypothetical protein GA0115259_103288, partial [Streptomyces sp. MnatMP-M17]
MPAGLAYGDTQHVGIAERGRHAARCGPGVLLRVGSAPERGRLPAAAGATPPCRLVDDRPELSALAVLFRDPGGKNGTVGVGFDGGQDQALQLGGVECLDFPLHRPTRPAPRGARA